MKLYECMDLQRDNLDSVNLSKVIAKNHTSERKRRPQKRYMQSFALKYNVSKY